MIAIHNKYASGCFIQGPRVRIDVPSYLHLHLSSILQLEAVEQLQHFPRRRTHVDLERCNGEEDKRTCLNNADTFKGWYRLTQSVGLHPRGGVDGVAEEAVARHLDADHPGAAGACRVRKEKK